ncbi:gene transfer agent family protein [Methylocystis suflitae]|uniref:gene transfer agent family protein n=1 Tax=Methylocystis suflitae TaxID=2951405 RepID=UPI00210E74AC|nr:gene transfer agent family protein [Methylocystis suflitae]MCQ4188161.1 gene transfer agent family protein [Methylocystis suflitae]
MANSKRGEIDATIDGKSYTLCLTLGALAELESGFGASDLVALASRFEERRLSARDILRIIGCGLRGAGNDISDEDVARMKVSEGLAGYVRIAADLLAATFGDAPERSADANPPTPQDA